MSGPDAGAFGAVDAGAVPAVAPFEVADPSFAAGSPFDGAAEAFSTLFGSPGLGWSALAGDHHVLNTEIGELPVDLGFAVAVVAANVAYPTDTGLLAEAVRRIAATGKRIQAAGGAVRTRVRDRSRAAGRRAHEIAAQLRARSVAGRVQLQATVARVSGELAGLAAIAAEEAQRLLANAKLAPRRARRRAA